MTKVAAQQTFRLNKDSEIITFLSTVIISNLPFFLLSTPSHRNPHTCSTTHKSVSSSASKDKTARCDQHSTYCWTPREQSLITPPNPCGSHLLACLLLLFLPSVSCYFSYLCSSPACLVSCFEVCLWLLVDCRVTDIAVTRLYSFLVALTTTMAT